MITPDSNPNCTMRCQSWPRRLWCQTVEKCSIIPNPAETSCKSFKNVKNDILKYILTIKHKKSGRIATQLPSPSAQFTAASDHPKAREVLMSCEPQSCTVPVRILISFWFQAIQSAWLWVLSWVHSLALSKWTDGSALFGQNPKTVLLYYTPG